MSVNRHINETYVIIEMPYLKFQTANNVSFLYCPGNKRRKHQKVELTAQEEGRRSNEPGEERCEAVPQLQDGECPFCFQAPCITLRNHAWIGPGKGACEQNSAIRREKYSKYWKVMTCLGAWNDPRYLQVKQDRANGGEWAISHRREVMPICVLQQLRTLYPNPKDKPYMDHKWE